MSMQPVPAALWEGRTPAELRASWRLPGLTVFERVGSTNDVARTQAIEGAPAGTIVMAESQTAGRGRLGRRWDAPHASSLMLSCVIRPAPTEDAAPGTLPLRIGMAAGDAIEETADVHVMLKWPNDLVIVRGGKIGGILCEALTTGDSWAIIAGIGINIRQQRDDWPDDLRDDATSLDAATHTATNRARLADALVERLRPLFTAPLAPLGDDELARFGLRDVLRDRDVIVHNEGRGDTRAQSSSQRNTGKGNGIDRDGALLLRTASGIERVTTGSVRLAQPLERSDARAHS